METRENHCPQDKQIHCDESFRRDDSLPRPPAFDDLKFIVKATLTLGARIVRELDRALTKINS